MGTPGLNEKKWTNRFRWYHITYELGITCTQRAAVIQIRIICYLWCLHNHNEKLKEQERQEQQRGSKAFNQWKKQNKIIDMWPPVPKRQYDSELKLKLCYSSYQMQRFIQTWKEIITFSDSFSCFSLLLDISISLWCKTLFSARGL